MFNEGVNFAGTTPTINFSATGSYTRAKNNGAFPADMTFTGAATSFTWFSQRNLNVSNVEIVDAAKIILSTSPTSPFPYPGRTVIGAEKNLGPNGTELAFDGGTLRMLSSFPYTSLSALNAAHPVSFTAGEDAGFENWVGTFTMDLPIDLGTGAFWSEGTQVTMLTAANTWGRLHLTSGTLEVAASEQLGPDSAPFEFGSGDPDNLSSGTLKIAGTTFSSFGARSLVVTDTKTAKFEIDGAAHTFTVDQALAMSTGGLEKSGAGTLVLTEANTYTGPTSVLAGTLALVGGSQDSPVTVSGGASLGFEIGVETTSTSTVDLTNGTVTISNPVAVDDESDYRLMTASAGFTVSDLATQLDPAISGYELQLQNADTELWLVVASSGTDYGTWGGGFTGFNDTTEDLDFDAGGLDSRVEYLLGGDPTDASDDAGKAPTVIEDGTNLTFTFIRDQASIHAGTTVTIEVGTDLAAWPDLYTVAADTAESSEGVAVTEDSPEPGFDTVTLTVPMDPDTKKFARLDVAIAP